MIIKKYFGTDGIRGRVGEYPITPDFALKLGYAFGKILIEKDKQASVIIGKDTRLSGYLFESSLEAGFCYAGVDVYMAGPISTPAIAFLTKSLRLSAGVVISASHNKYSDNGIKFFDPEGMKLSDQLEQKIEQYLDLDMTIADKLGKVKRLNDAGGRYIEYCKNKFPIDLSLKNINIILDCANGATYQIAPRIFRELGANIITINCQPDGLNINDNCGSTNVQSLQEQMVKYQYDIGIAYDGDGDRVIMVDKNGYIYDGDKLLYAIIKLYQVLGIKIDTVVGTIMTNLALENKLEQMNIKLIRAKVGDRYVLEELKNNNLLLGGESSGHILALDKHSSGDGIITSLLVLASMLKYNKTLEQIIDWQNLPQVLINVKLPSKGFDWQSISNIAIIDAKDQLGDNGRIVVRASGTEPLVRVMVEANNLELAQKLAQQIVAVISTN
jgi:phosphoglucosamine mutase